jgi:hypothetical protein
MNTFEEWLAGATSSIGNNVHLICSKPPGKDILLEHISFLAVGLHMHRSKDETLSGDL